MFINLTDTEYVDEVWVFDNMVPVWLSKETFRFYQKPLTGGGLSDPIPLDTKQFKVDKNIAELDFDNMRRINVYEMYGVSNSTLYYYEFTFNNLTQSIKITNETRVKDPKLNGSKFRIQVASEIIVISCSDCTTPAVNFYNKITLDPI